VTVALRPMPHHHHLDPAPFLVPPGKKIRLKDYDPGFTAGFKNKEQAREALSEDISGLAAAQDALWAAKECSIVIVLQALDAAGKDGTIKHVISGVNPQGVYVRAFKAPTAEELLHHFLWRPAQALPARGEMAIFNRSYYEEVLVVRVHPEFLERQWLPPELRKDHKKLWKTRYDEINQFEETCRTSNNTMFLKFFLNLSKAEQRKRFLARLDDPAKNWKFSVSDLHERGFWDDYQAAYEDMIRHTATDYAPWYVVPADNKWFTRVVVAAAVIDALAELKLSYPEVGKDKLKEVAAAKRALMKK